MSAEVLAMLDQAIAAAKAEAATRIAQDLLDMMRTRLPVIFTKIRNDLTARRAAPEAAIRAAISQALVQDRSFAGQFFLQRIAGARFRPFVLYAVAEAVAQSDFTVVAVAVDHVLAACRQHREICRARCDREQARAALLRAAGGRRKVFCQAGTEKKGETVMEEDKEFVCRVIVHGSDDLIVWQVEGGAFVFQNDDDKDKDPENLDGIFVPGFPKEIPAWFNQIVSSLPCWDAYSHAEGTREELRALFRLAIEYNVRRQLKFEQNQRA